MQNGNKKNENFKVNFANTERLKKSSIISMQNLLNTNFNENKKRKWGEYNYDDSGEL